MYVGLKLDFALCQVETEVFANDLTCDRIITDLSCCWFNSLKRHFLICLKKQRAGNQAQKFRISFVITLGFHLRHISRNSKML